MIYENCRGALIWSNFLSSLLTILVVFALYFLDPFSFLGNKKKTHPTPFLKWQTSASRNPHEVEIKRFAEANPFVPENLADHANLLASRNQQAAQPRPLLNDIKPSQLPESLGDSKNLKIVRPSKKAEQSVFSATNPPLSSVTKTSSTASSKIALMKQNPDMGTGHHLPKGKNHQNQKIIDLSGHETDSTQFNKRKEVINQPPTRARPKLSHDLLNGPILQNTRSVARVGRIAINSRLSPYGIYMEELLKAIENQWGDLIRSSIRYIQKDSLSKKITYTFTLMKSGNIKNLTERDALIPVSLPSELCRQAIASRAPFSEWDDKMIEEIGQSDQITITFNYF